jgi:alkanesulfonate monooxygenase SsuD/methylene tetrahydromethanopterin reductase-like flavin-dependent oxidoreductase (luciferase family)
MDIGIGLPNTVPDVDRASLLDWARRAEERGFSSLATLDRLAYPNWEGLVALGAVAAVTERVRLLTDVLNTPWRANAALLAKQAATLDALSEGRLTLGLGLGAREDDYELSGVSTTGRGRRFDEMLETMREAWEGDAIGPDTPGGGRPEVLIGGGVEAAYDRVARHADGWAVTGAPPDTTREGRERVLEKWREAGREGEPRVVSLCYFALGDDARETADRDLKHYYAWLGDDIAAAIAASAVVDADMARAYRDGFTQAGADELVYFPTSTDPAQVDLLAEAVL